MTRQTARKNKRNDNKPHHIGWRFQLVMVLVTAVFLSLMARAAFIQVVEPDMLQKQGDIRALRTSSTSVQRGMLLDRNGVELAVSVPVQTVWADPKIIRDRDALTMTKHWQALADVLGVNGDKLVSRVQNPAKRFVFLKRQIAPATADYIRKLKIPGVYLKTESKRFYPTGEVSAHLVGFTDIDDEGIEGLERQFNHVLIGEAGSTHYVKDAKGRPIEVLERTAAVKPEDINLSIDQRIQSIAFRALKAAVQSFQATSGSAVVVDVQTGEVLAMVNNPSYNPNNRRGVKPHRIRNRAITDIFEPGSTMKTLAVLSALEFGSYKSSDVVNTSPGWLRVGGNRVSDSRDYGELDLGGVLRKSSNVGTTKLVQSIPTELFLNTFYNLGMGEDTGTGLVGESSGLMRDSRRWSDFEKATLSFGYGVATTALQLANTYTIIANGGIKRPLTILKERPFDESERIFSEENTRLMHGMLESVVEEGGGKAAKVPGYRVAGKTGTAIKAAIGGYGDEYVGLFAGFAPVSDPRIAVVVVINEPSGDLYHGGEVAAPVFSRIVANTLPLLNIAPDAAESRVLTAKSPNQSAGEPNNG